MLKEKRIMQILDMIMQNGEVEISNLCRIFDVAEMTVRRDLDELAKQGKVIRTHGGAMLDNQRVLLETSFDRRIVSHQEKKLKIAKKALTYMKDGQTVFIDSGTTGYTLSQIIPNTLHITALTNAINIAAELIQRAHISVVMIGGELQQNTLSCRGTAAEEMVERFKVEIAFIGTNAISKDGELFIGNVTESGFKKRILGAAAKKIVLADSSKLNKLSLCRFAGIQDIDCIITDDEISTELYEELTGCGADIVIADGQ